MLRCDQSCRDQLDLYKICLPGCWGPDIHAINFDVQNWSTWMLEAWWISCNSIGCQNNLPGCWGVEAILTRNHIGLKSKIIYLDVVRCDIMQSIGCQNSLPWMLRCDITCNQCRMSQIYLPGCMTRCDIMQSIGCQNSLPGCWGCDIMRSFARFLASRATTSYGRPPSNNLVIRLISASLLST